MSFFKALIFAIFASILLTYIFGTTLMEWFNISVYMNDHHVEPLKALSMSALVMVVLIVATLAIVLTVFGTLIFAGLLALGGIMLVGVGVFWPVIFIAVIIWLCFREKRPVQV